MVKMSSEMQHAQKLTWMIFFPKCTFQRLYAHSQGCTCIFLGVSQSHYPFTVKINKDPYYVACGLHTKVLKENKPQKPFLQVSGLVGDNFGNHVYNYKLQTDNKTRFSLGQIAALERESQTHNDDRKHSQSPRHNRIATKRPLHKTRPLPGTSTVHQTPRMSRKASKNTALATM